LSITCCGLRVLSLHGVYLRDNRGMFEAQSRGVQKVVQSVRDELERVGEEKGYIVDDLLGQDTPEDGKDGEMDIMMVIDGTNGKTEVWGTIVVGNGGEDGEDEWIGLD
jgi:hypothetical protein